MDNPPDLVAWRKSQRAHLLARRVAVPETLRRQWNDSMTTMLLDAFPKLLSLVVGIYWPFKGEFDPRFIAREIRQHGGRTALPAVVRKAAPLQFYDWWPGVRMTKGVFDLPVPADTEQVTPEALLIPPIGFDAEGYRLGYGGGYFDRTLAAMTPMPLKIGVAFELSRINTIRPQPYDVPMDFIVTEAGIHRVDGKTLVRQ